jgi:hypothetical protein
MTVSTRRGLTTALVQVDTSSSVTKRLALLFATLHVKMVGYA